MARVATPVARQSFKTGRWANTVNLASRVQGITEEVRPFLGLIPSANPRTHFSRTAPVRKTSLRSGRGVATQCDAVVQTRRLATVRPARRLRNRRSVPSCKPVTTRIWKIDGRRRYEAPWKSLSTNPIRPVRRANRLRSFMNTPGDTPECGPPRPGRRRPSPAQTKTVKPGDGKCNRSRHERA